jgi:phosphatidylserine/phosphatidylglycerophosphate/cardiolipin synthase-like enzyme
MAIDDQEVITGRFNSTKAAESGNAENVLLIPHALELTAAKR